jgi:hypoxanthine phosphoribosyltransferase
VLIGVLKGAAIFLADLARAIKVDNTFDFVAVSSYGRARVSSGAVKLIKDIDNPIEGRHVILVEDILDTGLTLSYLRGLMLQHKPASLKIATCLDKPERRLVPIEADYACFKIPNRVCDWVWHGLCGAVSRRAGYSAVPGDLRRDIKANARTIRGRQGSQRLRGISRSVDVFCHTCHF